MDKSTYWSRSEPVQAVRLTEENFIEIAEEVGQLHFGIHLGFQTFMYKDCEVHMGDWYVKHSDGIKFWTDEKFAEGFRTHSEEMADDEKYARVFNLVNAAMVKQDTATYFGNGSSDEMHLLAVKATKEILRLV